METTTTEFDSPKALLESVLKQRKARNPLYSLRAFAKSLDLSAAQLSQLISGKRNFTNPVLKNISQKLSLSPTEERMLFESAFLAHAPELYLERKKLELKEDQFRLIADWYHFAILSLTKVKGAKADPNWISERLGIQVSEARLALERLQRLGIIQASKNLVQISEALNVTSETPSAAIQKYHKQILELGIAKLESVPLQNRDYSAMTMAVDPKKIPRARKMIADFQDQLALEMGSKNSDSVYVLSCQLFPLEKQKVGRQNA